MGSEANKINDGTGFQPSEPALCAKGCGFFGTAETMNLCSKCYRDLHVKEEQAASAKAAMDKLVNQNKSPVVVQTKVGPSKSVVEESSSAFVESDDEQKNMANRCLSCKKKVGVLGFKCRCGSTFCGAHRYPEKHQCEFDFKEVGKDAIAKANPVVKSDKIERF